MIPEKRVVDEKMLENGLTVYFYDLSRPVAGDRFQVQLKVHVPVKVREDYFKGQEDPKGAYETFTAAFGSTVSFEKERVRNFIDGTMVESVLKEMEEDVLASNLAYLSRPTFAEKYVSKMYSEWKEKQALQEAYRSAIKGTSGQ